MVKLQSPLANFYLVRMLQRTLPAGFIAPCLPTKTDKLPSGSQWLHEIKHDGFRIIARKHGARVRLYSRPGNDFTRRFPLIVEALDRLRSRSCIIDGEASPAMTISIRRSPRASRLLLLLRTAVEHDTAGGAKVATVMGHARPDAANVRDVLLAEPDRVRFTGRALPRGPFLRGGGPRPGRERETQERRSGYDWPEVWLGGTNVHYRPSIWLSWYLLLKRRSRQAASPCSRR
jgi:ATP dependent DNA ligase domain